MSIKPINKNVVFKFVDSTIKMDGKRQFEAATASGIVIRSQDESVKENRWGIVTAIGPDVKSELKVGDKILIEALKWTPSFKISNNDEPVWITSEDCILLVLEE